LVWPPYLAFVPDVEREYNHAHASHCPEGAAMPAIEDDYLDVLHNIETAIISVYRDQPGLVDAEADKALNTVLLEYQAELRGRSATPTIPGGLAELVYGSVKEICDWRLGREVLETAKGDLRLDVPPLTLDEIILCLKRIRKSIRMWTKQGGQRGYLNFVSEYLP
jgi:hypothetical protein